MRVLVCGGRDFGLLKREKGGGWEPKGEAQFQFGIRWLEERFADYLPDPEIPENHFGDMTIIEGGAKGADTIGADFAIVNWLGLETYKADWEKHGKAAGFIRNKQMLDEGKPDLVVAFPGGRGTTNMVALARAANIPVEEVEYGIQ